MDTPVPIPNTAVKHLSADNTWLATARESKSLPDLYESLEVSSSRLSLSAKKASQKKYFSRLWDCKQKCLGFCYVCK